VLGHALAAVDEDLGGEAVALASPKAAKKQPARAKRR
jgi:hypothetical protein